MSSRDVIEAEIRLFWCASSELRQAHSDGADHDTVAFHLGEIEAIWMHTEQPFLRQRCGDILDYARSLCPDCLFFTESRQDSVA